MGIDCNCSPGFFSKSGRACNHIGFIRDQKVIDFMLRSFVKDGDSSRIHGGKMGRFETFTDHEWRDYTDKCRLGLGNLFPKE